MNREFIARELVKIAKDLVAKKLWSVGDGWQAGLGEYDVEDYVMYAIKDMLKKLKIKIRLDYPVSSIHGELGRQIGLPSKWDKKNIEKVLDDLTDINYHSERRNIEDALEDRGIIIARNLMAQDDELGDLRGMKLNEIARLIARNWDNVYFGAKPYLRAMMTLRSINDDYGMDDGRSIVAYFLSNARNWRGPVAKAVKKELNRRFKG